MTTAITIALFTVGFIAFVVFTTWAWGELPRRSS